jgi:hypothetical protein
MSRPREVEDGTIEVMEVMTVVELIAFMLKSWIWYVFKVGYGYR